ncbi:unnamed protein product [Fusarium graminearum]|nr:hypothetical protein FG05_35387 [Fusarium graminearum]CZS73801.1 unnamed protein product [Fusarium graminearum]
MDQDKYTTSPFTSTWVLLQRLIAHRGYFYTPETAMRRLLPKTNTSVTRTASRAQVLEGITKKTQTTVACKSCRSRKVKALSIVR